jgi:hypothetical protein
MTEPITLRSPAEVVAAIPALLGFHPHDSLVAIWTSPPSGHLVCTLRIDLNTPVEELTRRLLSLATSAGTGQLLLAAYPVSLRDWIDSANEARVRGLITDVQGAGVEVRDALLVASGRWWSLMCADPDCCPIDGTLIDAATTPLEVVTVGAGHLAVAASREDVLARYQLRTDLVPDAETLDEASLITTEPLRTRCDTALAHLHLLATTSATARVPQHVGLVRAEVMWLLQDVTVRDWTIAHLATAHPDRALVEALLQVALTAPDQLRPRLAGASAAVLMGTGESPVAIWAMLDHAAGDSLAQLVAAGMDACAPPTLLQQAFAEAIEVIAGQIAAGNGEAA